jgi:hypothetical protein
MTNSVNTLLLMRVGRTEEIMDCYIDTMSLTVEEAATLYGFDADQREQLFALLSDRNKEMWEGLLS